MDKSAIPTPALLIDIEKVDDNIAQMANFFQHTTAHLRPHFKTHKCLPLAQKQIAAGAIGMTCAKLGEAEILVSAGISSIFIANEIVDPSKINRLAALARQTELIVAADDPGNLCGLAKAAQAAGSVIHVLVEVNVGLNRCGVAPGVAALDLARLTAELPGLHFAGLFGYEGHTQFITDIEQRCHKTESAMHELTSTADLIRQAGLAVGIVSAGGTGTFNISGVFPGITEIEAGSYLFMDSKYQEMGLPFRQSISLLSTVISTPTPQRAVIDAGMKAISLDNGLPKVISPGFVALRALHEEHGLLEVDLQAPALKVGDRVELVPSHVCTTVNLHDQYYVMRDDKVETVWPIEGRGKFQ